MLLLQDVATLAQTLAKELSTDNTVHNALLHDKLDHK